jgi:membrane-associated protease RseP (regulator of RpoE activity)
MEENKFKTYSIQLALFIATVFTTTYAGKEWMLLQNISWWEGFYKGFEYSIPFLTILTVHEFGHYITARIYKADVTLPYFIPLAFPFLDSIGTLGAFIRIKSTLVSRKVIFDVGIAGPLAGFVVAIAVLFYGFTHLPPTDYIFKVHPEYQKEFIKYGENYTSHIYTYDFAKKMHRESYLKDSLAFENKEIQDSLDFLKEQKRKGNNNPVVFNKKKFNGKDFKPEESYASLYMGTNLLFMFFEKYVVDDPKLIPNKYELFHYPFLFAGYLALFFTAFNLIPIGQLDGGHVTYGLFGTKNHKIISITLFIAFVYLAGVGIFHHNFIADAFASPENLLMFSIFYLYILYLIFSQVSANPVNNVLIAVSVFAAQYFTEYFFPDLTGFNGWFLFAFVIGRFLGVHHPPALDERPLDLKRKILGWLALVIFVICFTPQLYQVEILK